MSHSTTDPIPDQGIRRLYLLQFRVGGLRFAAEATTIASIAAGDWKPPRDSRAGRENRVVEMASLFDLSAKSGTRTLVVETSDGLCGFVVDSISKQDIELHAYRPVPPFLRDCLQRGGVSGFMFTNDEILSIVDLRRLARDVVSMEPLNDSTNGERS